MDIHHEFIGVEWDLVFYAGKPVLNSAHDFYDIDDNPWDFSAATSFSFKVWEEREGGLLMIEWDDANLTVSGNTITLNAQGADTNIEKGRYYYEMEYLVAGGYPVLLMYGQAKFI